MTQYPDSLKAKWVEYFEYNTELGKLVWIKRSGRRAVIGSFVGWHNIQGYIQFGLNKRQYLAHRVIWEMHYGEIPEGMQVDHINHIRDDNRLQNLRLVSLEGNLKNRTLDKRNKSGQAGVSFHKRSKKWTASIGVKGKLVHLGSFESLEEAVEVRKKAEEFYDFHPNNGDKLDLDYRR